MLVVLAYPCSSISEHSHPGTEFSPVIGVPGVLYGAKDPLGVRHHNGDSPIQVAKPCNSCRRAVGVQGVVCRWLPEVIHVLHTEKSVLQKLICACLRRKSCKSFAMCDRYRHTRTLHTGEQDGASFWYFNHDKSIWKGPKNVK